MKAVENLDIIVQKHGNSPEEWQNLLTEVRTDQRR